MKALCFVFKMLFTAVFNQVLVQGCGPAQKRQRHTQIHENFKETCGNKGETIWNIQSEHEGYYKDRVWSFQCRPNPQTTSSCLWSLPEYKYINSYNGIVDFKCPRNGFISGMYGRAYDSHHNDRRFDFKCCDSESPRQNAQNCKWTSYVNNLDGRLDFKLLSGYNLAGAYSYYDDFYEDRRWKFYVCQ